MFLAFIIVVVSVIAFYFATVKGFGKNDNSDSHYYGFVVMIFAVLGFIGGMGYLIHGLFI
jgi:hypothetical protein